MLRATVTGLAVLLSFCFPSHGQDSKSETTVSVPVVDMSAGGSPLAISGTLWLARRLRDSKLLTSEDAEVIGRNISNKPIVTLVTLMTGGSTKYTQQFEFFFNPALLEPAGTVAIAHKQGLWQGWSESPTSATELPSADASAEIQVLFVQFADGSTFGDKRIGRDYQITQHKTWMLLSELKQLYQNRGEAEFAKALDNQVQSDLINLTLGTIRETKQRRGSAAAFDRLNSMLAVAEQRKLDMGSAALAWEQ